MQSKLPVVIGTALIACLGYAYWGFDASLKRPTGGGIPSHYPVNRVEPQPLPSARGILSGVAASSDNWQPVINSRGFYQGCDYFTNEKRLVVMNKEWNWSTQSWDRSSYQADSSFEIVYVSTSGISDEFYVAGRSVSSGAAIIEHWVATPTAGSTAVTRNRQALPIQTPGPIASAVISVVGGTYQAPDARPLQDPVERFEIYTGTDMGIIWSLTPDPNERFLLVLALGGSVYQIDLISGSDPVEILSPALIPDLSVMTNLYPKLHPNLGVCYIMTPDRWPIYSDRMVVMYDYNNDGVVDNSESFSAEQFSLIHEGETQTWTEDMVNYYD